MYYHPSCHVASTLFLSFLPLGLPCRYLAKAGGVWSDIVCDGYCHRRLMFHMAAAGRGDLLGELLTDLHWVAACCRCWDANSLLASYTTFKDILDGLPEKVHTCRIRIFLRTLGCRGYDT